MKEAIGTTFVFNIVMIFVSIFIVLYVGSVAYSKGFKIRNRIIDVIEKYNGYPDISNKDPNYINQLRAIDEINENLKSIGYAIEPNTCKNIKNGNGKMKDTEKDRGSNLNVNSSYNYCVYKNQTSKGDYYGVTVFIKFDIPIIGSMIRIPIYGETRILFDKDRVEN